MKRLALNKLPPLAEHMADLDQGPILLMSNGRAVAAVVSLQDADAETISLSTNPKFIAMIERSRRSIREKGGIPAAEVRRRLGLRPSSSKVRKTRAR